MFVVVVEKIKEAIKNAERTIKLVFFFHHQYNKKVSYFTLFDIVPYFTSGINEKNVKCHPKYGICIPLADPAV